MFGGKSKKISNLEIFNKFSVEGKTITLTPKGGRTEDMKLFTIDFDEIKDTSLEFEDSEFYSYFTQKFLFILFQEPHKNSSLQDNIFLGFKRYSFSMDFVDTYVRKLWERIRQLVNNGLLKETVCYDKNHNPIINKTGVVRTELNFPKSSEHQYLFVRGTGQDSTGKKLELNGIKMYHQQVWIRGNSILLSSNVGGDLIRSVMGHQSIGMTDLYYDNSKTKKDKELINNVVSSMGWVNPYDNEQLSLFDDEMIS